MNSARGQAIRQWVTGTFSGRALAGGFVVKLLAALLRLPAPDSGLVELVDTIGDLGLVAGALTLAYRLFTDIRRVVLWRVRRKLTLSYIFMGFVPALLIICFFLLAGLLLFFNVSAYSVRLHVTSLVDRAQLIAQGAAQDVARSGADASAALDARRTAVMSRYPGISYVVVPRARDCGDSDATAPLTGRAGPWTHAPPPASAPGWVPCEPYSGVIAHETDGVTRMSVRAAAGVPGRSRYAVVVDLPIDAAEMQAIGDDIGIRFGTITTTEDLEAMEQAEPAPRRIVIGPMSVPPPGDTEATQTVGLSGLTWVALLDHVGWTSGETGTLLIAFSMSPSLVYQRISGAPISRVGNFTFGQILLILMGTVGALFLIIQLVAFLMGLALARSITGAVHELFVGTERVGRGDFAHKISVRSRDQLGALATSFNDMTSNIQFLLKEQEEKNRMEQELRIARSIQASLLPQVALRMPGLAVSPYCEPAREVGGDYYDYLPIDETRVGVLIADVSGKGTSAALYMAELKGVVLSLSQQYTSPRQLLIHANQIISRHLDTRSFITITYAVVDLRVRTLTYARAGHCPLIRVPGGYADSRDAQILTPDGMVLGLQIDDGTLFEQALAEVTVPLGTGDLFVFYTDGLTEAMNPQGDCYGDRRLADLVQRHADLDTDDLRSHILEDVRGFAADATQQDDLTMLLLRVEDGQAALVH